MNKHDIHLTPEEMTAKNMAGVNTRLDIARGELLKIQQEIKTGIESIRELKPDLAKSVNQLMDVVFAIDQSPKPVVKKLEEIKSASLIANKLLKQIKEKEIPQPKDFPTEMAMILKGVSMITIKGDKGDKGEKGDRGERGMPGQDGKDSTIPGPKGEPGRDGIDGRDGKDSTARGPKGEKGDRGNDGSPDAPDEVVDKVNQAKKKIKPKQIEGLTRLMTSIEDISNSPVGKDAGGGPVIRIKDEGVVVSEHFTSLNFKGTAVTSTYAGDGQIDVDITGGAISGSDTQMLYFNGNNNPAGASSFTFNDASGQTIIKPIGSNGEVLNVRNLANADIFIVDTTGFVTINAEITLGGRILPDVTNTHDLGSGSFAFRNIYFNGVLGDGINSVSLANICTLNTAQTISAAKTFGTTTKLQFTDANAYVNASSSGVLVLQGATSTNIGVAGDIVLGDGTLRTMYPQTHKKIDRGSAANSFNDDYLGGLMKRYNDVATAGWGIPAIYSAGRSTAQTAAVASVATYTVGASDGSFEVSANVLVTTATNHNFTVTCAYTDEGNTARTLTLSFTLVAGGTLVTAVANANGAVPYMGIPQHIRCKASTAITIATTGTFTTVTYNVEGIIKQTA